MAEDGSQEGNRPGGGTRLPPGTALIEFDLRSLRYRTLVGYLFAHPKLALALLVARPFMYKSMLSILLLCIVGGLAMASLRDTWGADEIRSCVEFFHASVGDTRLTEKSLSWAKSDAVLPAAWERDGFRLTITRSTDAALAQQESALPSMAADVADSPVGSSPVMGLVVSPEHVWCWSGAAGTGDMVWQELPVLGHLKGLDGSGDFFLNEKTIPTFAHLFAVAVFFSRWFMESSALISQWLVWCAMLSLLSLFTGVAVGSIRRGQLPGGAGGGDVRGGDVIVMPLWRRLQVAVSLSANMTLIPMLAALIYSASGFGSPASLVGFMFFIYLIYGAIEGRRGMLVPPASPRGGGRRQ